MSRRPNNVNQLSRFIDNLNHSGPENLLSRLIDGTDTAVSPTSTSSSRTQVPEPLPIVISTHSSFSTMAMPTSNTNTEERVKLPELKDGTFPNWNKRLRCALQTRGLDNFLVSDEGPSDGHFSHVNKNKSSLHWSCKLR
ncbi:hypothetical protein CROQUDRAFT_710680 [Cronartium quercuum f. sp. fusiforme G11]|uniref:Uncharacterized protein n=1 Tax=Cronartium quercuum f. sp. fusiforme G11 TaxID=708437 RepID=A0A9P6NGW5_9BASI|nr:hypothetical protein CROQUDRAFT_710680 [Cronartium quercuum f. sp. fusiforme G11]